MFALTKGSLKKILDNVNVSDPVLQITQMKHIQNNMDGVTRYKVTLWDGESQHTFGILATQKNDLVENGEFKIGTVIKLEEYAANVLSKDPPKVVIILLNFTILGEMEPNARGVTAKEEPVEAKPSRPYQNENTEPTPANSTNKPTGLAKPTFYKDSNKPAGASATSTTPLASSNRGNSDTFNGLKIFGISSLNPYQNKWSIKVRVTNKSGIKTYTNAKGEGKLFNVEFIDGTGEIRASGFNDQCDKFYDMLQLDNVYYVSRAMLKTANRQYSKIDNDYEMTFTNDTVIEQCHESADNIPHLNMVFIKIAEIGSRAANEFIDVLGVVKSVGDIATIVTKATNRELKKRDVQLVDNSNAAITCTLWGKQAEDFDGADNPVLLLKGAKVGDYNGRTLSVAGTTVMQLNPDTPEAHTLKGWFDQEGCDCELTDLSNAGGAGGSQAGNMTVSGGSATWTYLDKVKEMGMGDKADYVTSKAYVLYAKKDNSMYMACPGENCNKKVIDQNDGSYRCEKCSKSYDKFNWRMILSINMADFSDSNWATCFQESAEMILGAKADELGEMKLANDSRYDEIFTNCVFQEFNFKLRAKMETYNDEKRVKVSVVSMEPIDYVQSGRRMLAKIKQFAKTQV